MPKPPTQTKKTTGRHNPFGAADFGPQQMGRRIQEDPEAESDDATEVGVWKRRKKGEGLHGEGEGERQGDLGRDVVGLDQGLWEVDICKGVQVRGAVVLGGVWIASVGGVRQRAVTQQDLARNLVELLLQILRVVQPRLKLLDRSLPSESSHRPCDSVSA